MQAFDAMVAERRALLQRHRIGVLLAGFPKCGTTSLAAWLDRCEALELSQPKESFLLCPEFGRPPADERRLFVSGRRRVEASTLNVYSAALRQAAAGLGLRCILITRDPVAQLVSWHGQMQRAGLCGGRTLSDLLEQETSPPRSPDYLRYYRGIGSQGYHAAHWLDALGHDRLLLLRLEEMRRAPEAVRQRLMHFLNLRDLPGPPPLANGYRSLRHPAAAQGLAAARALERRLPSWLARLARAPATRDAARSLFLAPADKPAPPAGMAAIFANDQRLLEEMHRANHARWGALDAVP